MRTFSTNTVVNTDELLKNVRKIKDEIRKHEPYIAEIRVNTKACDMLTERFKDGSVVDTGMAAFFGIPIVICLDESAVPLVEVVWRFALKG